MQHIASMSASKTVAAYKLCEAIGLPRSSYQRHKQEKACPATRRHDVRNKLPDTVKETVIEHLHSEAFKDTTPYQFFYHMLDEGHYFCSIRSIYRILDELGENKERRNQRCHRNAIKPELMAEQPNQVWSWDITKLKSTRRLTYFHLYVLLDIYSRYVVGWMIAERECKQLARQLLHKSILKYGIQKDQLTVHSDNGPSMTSQTVAQLLEYLGVQKTHNRPYTSNDNPFSESQFKTLKYCPDFPRQFDSLTEAEAFCQQFFQWYNQQHYHSGIAWLTPECVHFGKAETQLSQRHLVLSKAYQTHPERFAKPPIKKKLMPVYINPPKNTDNLLALPGENMA